MKSLPRDVEVPVLRLCQDIATPRSLTVFLMVKFSEWDQLADLRCDPDHYLHSDHYRLDACVTDLLRKLEDLPTSHDRAQKARDNFWLAEKECYRTNLRLRPYRSIRYPSDAEKVVLSFLERAKKNVAGILGHCPDLVVGRFGPGATYGDRGRLTTVPDKMSSRPTLTASAYPFLFQWSGTAWASACAHEEVKRYPLFIRGNRFTTVPKDCTKDRGIAVEPSVNLFYQLGYGRVIRTRLKEAGINLLKAQDLHRLIACEASIKGHLATLDLSNASDTVCSELVRLLLPYRWFEALNMLRSPTTTIDGKTVVLEKFSSMGNGYTFELETVIFSALVLTAVQASYPEARLGRDVFVYGDDIICPSETFKDVSSTLRYFGFTLNERKSFSTGYFRESCGGDFFNGEDVRPYFLKELPREPQDHIGFANGIRKAGFDLFYDEIRPEFRRCWFSILDAVPSSVRKCKGPPELGDIVIHDVPSQHLTRWRGGIRYFRCYRPARFRKVPWQHFRPEVVLACAVYGTGGGRDGVTPRDAVMGYKIGWVPLS